MSQERIINIPIKLLVNAMDVIMGMHKVHEQIENLADLLNFSTKNFNNIQWENIMPSDSRLQFFTENIHCEHC